LDRFLFKNYEKFSPPAIIPATTFFHRGNPLASFLKWRTRQVVFTGGIFAYAILGRGGI
jgi:hypothetical protein